MFVHYILKRESDRERETDRDRRRGTRNYYISRVSAVSHGVVRVSSEKIWQWRCVAKIDDGDTDSGGPRAWTAQTSLYCIHCLSVLYRVCV